MAMVRVRFPKKMVIKKIKHWKFALSKRANLATLKSRIWKITLFIASLQFTLFTSPSLTKFQVCKQAQTTALSISAVKSVVVHAPVQH